MGLHRGIDGIFLQKVDIQCSGAQATCQEVLWKNKKAVADAQFITLRIRKRQSCSRKEELPSNGSVFSEQMGSGEEQSSLRNMT